ncbi:MAG: HAMP domain-containing histidine kinase [Clostridiaceae bacterium]|jgi:signal transduction histidine kinase|nr:HAMP domain-containing histidine kinase [Clostridiaceae bacterium]
MSIRLKLPLLVLSSFIINILLVYGYYSLFLSKEISSFNTSVREQLQADTDSIAKQVEGRDDFVGALQDISMEKSLIIEVSDEQGQIVLSAGEKAGVNVENSAASLFRHDDRVYLLKVTQPMSIMNISAYRIGRNILRAEIIIIFIILLFSAVPIYLDYVKPIFELQKSIGKYKEGVRPERTVRTDEIGLLRNEFAALTDAIEKEKKKQLLIIASISHDIKTPLTSIMGFAERLKKRSLSADRHDQYVNIIYNKAVSINNLVEEFDDYLNLNKQIGIKQQKISVDKFCAVLKSDYEAELTERGVAFSVDVFCPEEMILVDLSKMRRVFGNIIGNSLKHFSRQAPAIAVYCSRQGDSIIFSVEDNGTGVCESELDRIFDPFYTSDKGRSVAGLGLSICREIVEACGGTIWAQNNESGGTAIKISLPVVNAALTRR